MSNRLVVYLVAIGVNQLPIWRQKAHSGIGVGHGSNLAGHSFPRAIIWNNDSPHLLSALDTIGGTRTKRA
jgi:hypothetical protein